MNSKIIASFVHGYNDLDLNVPSEDRPSLMVIENEKISIFSYPFPRNPNDFNK